MNFNTVYRILTIPNPNLLDNIQYWVQKKVQRRFLWFKWMDWDTMGKFLTFDMARLFVNELKSIDELNDNINT